MDSALVHMEVHSGQLLDVHVLKTSQNAAPVSIKVSLVMRKKLSMYSPHLTLEWHQVYFHNFLFHKFYLVR